MIKSMLTTAAFAVACNFSHAAGVPAICKGQFAMHYTQAHMNDAKFAAQTVSEMSVKFLTRKTLLITVRLNGDKDAAQYSAEFDCNSSLLCKDLDEHKIQLTKYYRRLIVKNLDKIVAYDQGGHSSVILTNKPGGDDVFELNQLTDVRDCT
jgi:hypothetical protein